MRNNTLNILIADDDEGDRKQIKYALKESQQSYECTETTSIEEALKACEECAFDCAFVDYQLPGQDGLEGITLLHERFPHMAIIMFTGKGDEMIATDAMKRGALDYISKNDITAESLRHVSESAMEKAALQRKVAQQREDLEMFASVLVHDLKSPLISIQSLAHFIEEDLGDKSIDKSEIVDHCQRVIQAGQRMNALISTLHEYTKAEEQVTFESVEMHQVLKDTLSNLEHLTHERGAHITYDELPAITGNTAQLIQLLQNLISNGIKYCEADIPAIHIAASPQEGSWLFSVKDNGIGIPEKYYQRIFAPFKRLHGAGKYEGTGLGLATCKKIVERHGGNIWCESKEGQGATFFFTLPEAKNHTDLSL